MPSSTQVRFQVAYISLEFVFCSSIVANAFRAKKGRPYIVRGVDVRYEMATLKDYLPALEFSLIEQVMKSHDSEFDEDDRRALERAYNDLSLTITLHG